MEMTEYRQCVAKPISSSNPVGERLVDHPLFDFIEDQMMKVGSLSHASVQWDEVEHSTLKLLGEQSKDIKLLVTCCSVCITKLPRRALLPRLR